MEAKHSRLEASPDLQGHPRCCQLGATITSSVMAQCHCPSEKRAERISLSVSFSARLRSSQHPEECQTEASDSLIIGSSFRRCGHDAAQQQGWQKRIQKSTAVMILNRSCDQSRHCSCQEDPGRRRRSATSILQGGKTGKDLSCHERPT